jgi:hypothetical protein
MAQVSSANVPWSLVLKVLRPPTPGKHNAWMELDERHLLYWRREALAYESGLLTALPSALAAPHCYRLEEHPDGSVWLWLEELRADDGRTWQPADYVVAARNLGRFGGAYATGHPLPDYPWFCGDQPAGWFGRFATNTAAALDSASWSHPLIRSACPVSLVDRLRRLVADREVFRQGLARLPLVLCHHDTLPRNLFSRQRDGREVTVAVDWASVGTGQLGADWGMLLGGGMFFGDLDPAVAAREELAIFDGYLAGLRDAGWRGDARLARLGCVASVSMIWGVPTWVPLAVNEQYHGFVEQFWGRPIAETVKRWANATRVLLDLGDEARAIL